MDELLMYYTTDMFKTVMCSNVCSISYIHLNIYTMHVWIFCQDHSVKFVYIYDFTTERIKVSQSVLVIHYFPLKN